MLLNKFPEQRNSVMFHNAASGPCVYYELNYLQGKSQLL